MVPTKQMPTKLVPVKRPRSYSGTTTYYLTACGKVFVTVNVDEYGYPVEVFASLGKVGGCSSAFVESVGRTLSISLRCGVDAAELAAQYIGITCQSGSWDDGKRITSCATAIGLALKSTLNRLGISVKGTVDDGVGARASNEASNGVGTDVSVQLNTAAEEADALSRIDELRKERDRQGL